VFVSGLRDNNFEINAMRFTTHGTAYFCSDSNPKTMVFVHGVGIVGAVWQPQLNYFSNTYQTVTYDLLGHGKSPMPQEEVTLDDYVEQLNDLVEFLEVSSFSLVGHSMGAIISIAFALKYPNKVEALVPMNIVFNRTDKAQLEVLERANQVLNDNKILNVQQTLDRWFRHNNNKKSEKIAKVKKWLEQSSPRGYGLTYRLFALSDKVFLNKLSNLCCPVLYLTGDDDPNSTPEMSRKMAKLTPLGEFVSVEGEAHMLPYIAANKANPIIENYLKNAK
jgi:pimeloyl-ACP methyl ester carboxylesterase|tara:strand:+ start:220 stop:1050 length:831 start_codon:yes stop_codon:yes gene_type:complete